MPSNPRGPMLAQKYDPSKVAFPCVVQPKLDGVRCLAYVGGDGIVTLRSRDDKPLIMPHVVKAVEGLRLPPGTVLDGELYSDKIPFQELSGHVRRSLVDERKLSVGYHVYDVLRGGEGQNVQALPYFGGEHCRAEWLVGWLGELVEEKTGGVINHVPVRIAKSTEDITKFSAEYEQKGFEGAMVRTSVPGKVTKKNPEPATTTDFYEAEFHGGSRRSWFLQKVKTFEDSEAEIIGIEEEIDLSGVPKGRTGKFVMRTPDGVEFRASGITDEMKAHSWANRGEYVGKTATYKFFGTSTEGVPRHPNFKALRPKGEVDEAA